VDGFQFIPDWASIAAVDPSDLAAPVENYRLTAALKSGDILTGRHLEKIPAVDFGDHVRVILQSGNIELITEAKAMRTAYAGDRITFQSQSSGEEFEALVIARNLARIGGESSEGE
jgi:flagella basal body P-ring formation protein FlgA